MGCRTLLGFGGRRNKLHCIGERSKVQMPMQIFKRAKGYDRNKIPPLKGGFFGWPYFYSPIIKPMLDMILI